MAKAQAMLRTTNGDYWISHLPMNNLPISFDTEAEALAFVQPLMDDPGNRESLQYAYVNVYGGPHGCDATTLAAALYKQTLQCSPVTGGGLLAAPAAKPAIARITPAPKAQTRPQTNPPQQALRYKIQLEIAGQPPRLNLSGQLAISQASTPNKRHAIPTTNHSQDKHRLEWHLEKVDNVPHQLWYSIAMQGSPPMHLRLCEQLAPVEHSTQTARWPTVLVPLQLLRLSDPPRHARENAAENAQDNARLLSGGWVYVFINGHLFRELQVINDNGVMRDVDLGANDGVGDQRRARGGYLDHVLVPYRINGQPQRIEIAYSRLPFTWETLGRLGGIAPSDDRFFDHHKRALHAIARDNDLCQQWLQAVDLSGYGAGFTPSSNPTNNNVGPIASALPPGAGIDRLKHSRHHALPVVYLHDKPVKKRVIPVIYVPGIFGSRLERPGDKPEDQYVWDPDAEEDITSHFAKSLWSGLLQRTWNDREINDKVGRLHDVNARVMNDYNTGGKKVILKALKKSKHFQQEAAQVSNNPHDPTEQDALLAAMYQRRAQRGWLGILSDYTPLMEAIELIEDEHFIYRCHGAGRDWRNDLALEAADLQQDIARIKTLSDYPELGRQGIHYDAGSENPIVITHSQGSLIARYASEVLGANANIQGMVHLNQPTTGSPVLYRRFLFGAHQERVLAYSFSRFKSNIFSEIIGSSAYHFTRIGNLPGVYALLPTNDYVHQAGAATNPEGANKAHWLTTEPGHLKPDTITDIYDDVYLDEQVGLLCHKRYDAGDRPNPYTPQEFTRVTYEDDFGDEVDDYLHKVDPEYLNDRANIYLPNETPWHHDNMRLRLSSGTPKNEIKKRDKWYKAFKAKLLSAKKFHHELGVSHHPTTYVVRSDGLDTVINVHLFINRNQVLECPLNKAREGDGTVPLTSQEALLNEQAKPAGDIITQGNVIHADICAHKEAIEQTQQAIVKIVKPLRPSTKQRLFVI